MLIRKHYSIQDSLRIRKVLRRALYVLRDRRIQLPQERNDLQTDFITEYVSLQIGMVGDVFLPLYPQVLFYLCPETPSSGRRIFPFLGWIPVSPRSPVPRTRFRITVSTVSSR